MASNEYINLSNLGDVITKELEKFEKDVYGAMVETCEESIKEAKKEIKRDYDAVKIGKSSRKKPYRSTFTTRKKGDLSRILWNKQYPLSHLLENGHYVYNQYGGPYEIKKSKYGTSGDITKSFVVWELTEKNISEFVEKTLLKKLK